MPPMKTQDPAPADDDGYENAAQQTIELGNKLAEDHQELDPWDIADGLLAGAVQYWLYSRQPCADRRCTDCAPLRTAEDRLAEIEKLVREFAEESEYFHSPHDTNVGRA